MATHTFFVTGASGGQGGAVARQLLAAGHKVNALVRSPEKVQDIIRLGAKVVTGDYDNTAALAEAVQDCVGAFLNTMPTRPSEDELRHVSNILTAAKDAGVSRIVYSSAARAEDHESFSTWDPNGLQAGYWRTKTKIQEMVQHAGIESWTILQPAWIMTNWISPVSKWYWAELAAEKILVTAFGPETKVHLTDPADIGRFAVEALTSTSGVMVGKVIKVAGDELTIGEIAEAMTLVAGVEVSVKIRSDEEIEKLKGSNPFVASQLWQRLDGSRVDLQQVKSYGLEVTTFRKFSEANKAALLSALDK